MTASAARAKHAGHVAAWVLLLTTAVLVVAVGGLTNPLTAWNLVPLLLSALLLRRSADSSKALAVVAVVVGLVGVAHMAWLFDWAGTATGSSTAALLFVLLPVLAFFASAVTWGLAAVICRHRTCRG